MTLEEFKKAIKNKKKPEKLDPHLEAMYEDAIGNWDGAHDIAQNISNKLGSLIHAYLHRKEGDNWNANYWYNQAGRKMPNISLEQEWNAICFELLND